MKSKPASAPQSTTMKDLACVRINCLSVYPSEDNRTSKRFTSHSALGSCGSACSATVVKINGRNQVQNGQEGDV